MGALRLALLVAASALATPAAAASVDRWSGLIAEASSRFGVPEAWIRRVMQAESDGRTVLNGHPIESRAGAMGLMQLMPATWRDMRTAHGLGSDPHNPRDNIFAGTAYLRIMYDRFGFPGLFAAYNAGPARYSEHLSTGRRLPAETVAYVANVASDVSEDSHGRPVVPAAQSSRALFAFVAAPPAAPIVADDPSPAPHPAAALFVRLTASQR